MRLQTLTTVVSTVRSETPGANRAIGNVVPGTLSGLLASVRSGQQAFTIPLGTDITVRRMPYAQLGDIRFEVLGALAGLETKRTYGYARHPVIEGKPRLQAIGDELEELKLLLRFKESIGDPAASYADLCMAAAQHQALPFIFASGIVAGHFVIAEVADVVDQTDAGGRVTERTTSVTLMEWVAGDPIEVAARARQTSAKANVEAAPKTTKPGAVIRGGDPDSVPTSVIIRGRP